MTSFRQPAPLALAGFITAIGALPLLKASPLYAFIPAAAVLFGIWAWRSGTDVTPGGIRVRALLGSQIIAWSQVEALVPAPRGKVEAALTGGSRIRLNAVRPEDLPKLVAAGGGELADGDDAGERPETATQ
ncbi:MAG: PH domain-containing protein [Hamadaea sp.]|nr:PH domain-containing protein [Hamadaea sp.]